MKRNYRAEIVKKAESVSRPELKDHFIQLQSAGERLNSYKHKESGEIINLINGTWRVDRKDGSKGSLGNGTDMYRYEDLKKAMEDVHARAEANSCPTCKGKRFLENHKAIYDCPDCGEKMAIPPTPNAKPNPAG